MATDYERIADRYDEDRARWDTPPDDVVVGLVAVRQRARVLDVGCGTGTWLRAQAAVVGAAPVMLIGADPAAAMLRVAQGKGVRNLTRAGAEALPFAAGAFDYVVANFTFHHWDKERALDEIARVVAPGGAFRINNIEPAAVDGWWLYEFFPEAVAVDAARFWPAARIARALEARGFAVEVHLEVAAAEVAAADALADAERRVISQLAVLDDAVYAAGLARLRAVVSSDAAQPLPATHATLRLTARPSPPELCAELQA